MKESKMEINIINIEDRHQEKAYAIWKAGILRITRYDYFSRNTRSWNHNDLENSESYSVFQIGFNAEDRLFRG